MENLSDEIIIRIINYLPIKIILKNCQFVCRKWNNIANDRIVKSSLINSTLRKKKCQDIQFDKSLYSNYNLFKKTKLKFYKMGYLDKPRCTIKFNRKLLKIWKLQWRIGSLMKLPPFKIKFKESDFGDFNKIIKFDERFIMFADKKKIRLEVQFG